MPNKKPKISIIIPMYNVEKYLKRCLDSVRAQTFTDFQAILVDDGSPDKSGEIAESYAALDKRFIVVHKENGGLSDARNVGMSKASGEYIMYLDSDDFIHPQTMEIAYSLAQRDNSDIVSFTYDRLTIVPCPTEMKSELGISSDMTSFCVSRTVLVELSDR